jgi:signal peptidase II
MFVVFAADLSTKTLAFQHVADEPIILSDWGADGPTMIPPHEAIEVVPHVLSLHLTTNTGAVFGLGKGMQWLFGLVSAVAVIVMLTMVWTGRVSSRVQVAALGLIAGGAIGNLYDRVRFHVVRDMLWLLPDTRLWPWIFNLADAAMVVGVLGLIFFNARSDKLAQSDQTSGN